MRTLYQATLFALFVIVSTHTAAKTPLQFCEEWAKDLDAETPEVIDGAITMTSVRCKPSKPKPVVSARMELDLDRNSILKKGDVARIKSDAVSRACPIEEVDETLSKIDFEYQIFSTEKAMVYQFKITQADCRAYNSTKATVAVPPKRASVNDCKEVAKEISESLPLKADEITTVNAVFCRPGNPKPSLNYRVDLEVDAATGKEIEFETALKPRLKRSQCTTPNGDLLLKSYDINYFYYSEDGSFLNSLGIKESDCNED